MKSEEVPLTGPRSTPQFVLQGKSPGCHKKLGRIPGSVSALRSLRIMEGLLARCPGCGYSPGQLLLGYLWRCKVQRHAEFRQLHCTDVGTAGHAVENEPAQIGGFGFLRITHRQHVPATGTVESGQ